jgi:hypothetical protein
MHDVTSEMLDKKELDPRLSRPCSLDGKNFVPAHQQVFAALPAAMKETFYLHYMWSNVSCVRVRKNSLAKATRALKNEGEYASGFLLETRFRAAIEAAIGDANISFDTCRENDGYKGYYAYLGTSNKEALKRKQTRDVKEELPKQMVLSDNIKEALIESLSKVKEELK